jgi:hypothetical protein
MISGTRYGRQAGSATGLRRSGALLSMLVAGLIGSAALASTHFEPHRAAQERPIELGTSGGNVHDRSKLYCCSGTLGALVADAGGALYILSNNHVLAKSNSGTIGDPVSQPGVIETRCQWNDDQIVGELSRWSEIGFRESRFGSGPTNEVDAAIALARTGAAQEHGSIIGIGTVSGNTRNATLGMAVQKSGRTTGLTTGEVIALNVTVDVGFPIECGSNKTNVARFVNQIRIGDGNFSAGGDSGSLVVEHGTVDSANGRPRAVGLLFAGSSTSTLANPIDSVLGALGVTMVTGDGTQAPAPVGTISGRVRGPSGDIEGAQVSVDGRGITTETGSDGRYTLANVPTGSQRITVTAGGYEAASRDVTVTANANTVADFTLTPVSAGNVGEPHVSCIVYTTRGGAGNNRHLEITIRAVGASGEALANTRVDIDVHRDGTHMTSGSGALTGSNGSVTYTLNNAPNGEYVTTVIRLGTNTNVATPTNRFLKGTDVPPVSNCVEGASGASAATEMERAVGRAARVLRERGSQLFEIAEVVGHGVGLGNGNQPVIEVYLARESSQARARIPAQIQSVPVHVIVTGPFRALPAQCATPDDGD